MSSVPSNRRHFIASVAGGMAGIAVLGHAQPVEGAVPLASHAGTGTGTGRWDDSWTQRLGQHRVVFDVSELEQAPGADVIPDVMDAYHEALGATDRELGMVLVLRHRAVPLFFSDALWAKYEISKDMKEKDEKTNAPWAVNPKRQDVAALQARGVVVLGCNRAVSGFITRMAEQHKAKQEEVRAEVMANLMPGVILQPNGLYALARAQEVGCGFMR